MGFLGKCRFIEKNPKKIEDLRKLKQEFPNKDIRVEQGDANNQPRPEAVVLGRPPEGADYVRLPPLGAWSWSGPSFLPGTGRGFSVDDDFQAYPLSCESLPKP